MGLASAAGEADAATFLGGRWTPASVWRMVEEMRKSDPRVQAMLDEDDDLKMDLEDNVKQGGPRL